MSELSTSKPFYSTLNSNRLLIAIFPLQGAYPDMAIGLALHPPRQYTDDKADLAIINKLFSAGTLHSQESIRWHDQMHWCSEKTAKSMSVFELDAYDKFFKRNSGSDGARADGPSAGEGSGTGSTGGDVRSSRSRECEMYEPYMDAEDYHIVYILWKVDCVGERKFKALPPSAVRACEAGEASESSGASG